MNEDKRDNRAENLVVSCNRCNLQRTPALAFMGSLTTDALIDVMEEVQRRRKTMRENRYGNGLTQ